MWEVSVKFHGYRIYGLTFDPPNPKNIVFESLRIKKAIFMHILITASLIPIPFLPSTFFWRVGALSQVSWLSDIRLAFWTPNLNNLVFENTWVEKDVFMHILITRSPIPIQFLCTTLIRCVGGVRYVSWISDLRVSFWPPKSKSTQFLKDYELKMLFSWISG